jgi:competence protein ComEC
MRGKLFFISTAVFAVGILYGTFSKVSLAYGALILFFGLLLLASYYVLTNQRATPVLLGALMLITFSLGEVRSAFAPKELPMAYESLIHKPISLTGIIISDPDIREKNQQIVVSVNRNGQPTNILVFAPLFQHFAYGEKILIAGTLIKPAPFSTDGGRTFRYDTFLAKKGIFALVPQADILEVAAPTGLLDSAINILFAFKHTFVEGLARALPDPYAQLATGLLTGDQHGLSDSLVTTLALSGLIWIVVLSGYHITLIAEAVLKIFRFFPHHVSYLLAGMSVLAIIFATGASAPSLRGGIMACLTLFARSTGRTYDALRALCAAVFLVLIWNPLLLAYDSGFQLSIAVTPALILGTPILEKWLLRVCALKDSFVREIVTVSVVAQLACLPLILWQTGQLSVWSIPANMMVMWLVPPGMFFAVVAGFFGVLLPWLAPLAGLPAYGVLYYILSVARLSASLPFAATVIPVFPFVCTILMYAIFVLIGYLISRSNRPKVSISKQPGLGSAFL